MAAKVVIFFCLHNDIQKKCVPSHHVYIDKKIFIAIF